MNDEKQLEPVADKEATLIKEVRKDEYVGEQIVRTYVIKRAMRFYPLTDSEFESMSYLTTELSVLLAVGPALAGISITALLTLFTVNSRTDPIAFGIYVAIGIAFLIASMGIFFYMWKIYKEKNSVLARWRSMASDALVQNPNE